MVAMPVYDTTTMVLAANLCVCVRRICVDSSILHSILTYCVRVHQTMAVIMCYIMLYHVSFNLHISQFNCPNERNEIRSHHTILSSFSVIYGPGVRVFFFRIPFRIPYTHHSFYLHLGDVAAIRFSAIF